MRSVRVPTIHLGPAYRTFFVHPFFQSFLCYFTFAIWLKKFFCIVSSAYMLCENFNQVFCVVYFNWPQPNRCISIGIFCICNAFRLVEWMQLQLRMQSRGSVLGMQWLPTIGRRWFILHCRNTNPCVCSKPIHAHPSHDLSYVIFSSKRHWLCFNKEQYILMNGLICPILDMMKNPNMCVICRDASPAMLEASQGKLFTLEVFILHTDIHVSWPNWVGEQNTPLIAPQHVF